jgi:hypothetical protein
MTLLQKAGPTKLAPLRRAYQFRGFRNACIHLWGVYN